MPSSNRQRQAARHAGLRAQHVGELATELVRHPAAAGVAGVELPVGVDAEVLLDLLVQQIEVAVLDGRRARRARAVVEAVVAQVADAAAGVVAAVGPVVFGLVVEALLHRDQDPPASIPAR